MHDRSFMAIRGGGGRQERRVIWAGGGGEGETEGGRGGCMYR